MLDRRAGLENRLSDVDSYALLASQAANPKKIPLLSLTQQACVKKAAWELTFPAILLSLSCCSFRRYCPRTPDAEAFQHKLAPEDMELESISVYLNPKLRP